MVQCTTDRLDAPGRGHWSNGGVLTLQSASARKKGRAARPHRLSPAWCGSRSAQRCRAAAGGCRGRTPAPGQATRQRWGQCGTRRGWCRRSRRGPRGTWPPACRPCSRTPPPWCAAAHARAASPLQKGWQNPGSSTAHTCPGHCRVKTTAAAAIQGICLCTKLEGSPRLRWGGVSISSGSGCTVELLGRPARPKWSIKKL